MNAYARFHWLFAWLNFALVVPGLFLWLGLPMLLRQQGWSGGDIGFFQLAGLPVVFKFAMALPIERKRATSRTCDHWLFALCLPLLAGLLWVATQPVLMRSPLSLFGVALVLCILATWADVPLNALAYRLFPPAERSRAGGYRSAALFCGAVTGGGLLVLVHTHGGWAAPFCVMAVLLASGLIAHWLLDPSAATITATESAPTPSAMHRQLRAFYQQPGAWGWTLLLLTYFPCMSAAWVYVKPMLIDAGAERDTVALMVGVGGGIVGALASMLTGQLCQGMPVRRLLLLGAVVGVAGLISLTCLNIGHFSTSALLAGSIGLAFAMGMMATAAFTTMMHYARAIHAAQDYGWQASLFSLGRLLFAATAGVLLDLWGHVGLYTVLTAILVCVTIALANTHATGESTGQKERGEATE